MYSSFSLEVDGVKMKFSRYLACNHLTEILLEPNIEPGVNDHRTRRTIRVCRFVHEQSSSSFVGPDSHSDFMLAFVEDVLNGLPDAFLVGERVRKGDD